MPPKKIAEAMMAQHPGPRSYEPPMGDVELVALSDGALSDPAPMIFGNVPPERKCDMRATMRLTVVLAALLLFVIPVLGIDAQGGAALNGYIWNGTCFLPEVAGSVLLATGRGIPNGAPLNGYSWDGACFLPEVAAFALP